MLSQLYIENIAVIEKTEIEFPNGFIALTGETGAGKSIIIDSINAVLGERVSKEMIRSGADSAFVSAVFTDISDYTRRVMLDIGFESEDGSVLIQRTISRDGKSAAKLNGRPITVSLLREIGRTLVNIHGQHENQALLSPENHLKYLDKLAEDADALEEYRARFADYRRAAATVSELEIDEDEKERKTDMLRFAVNEIKSAKIREGELAELTARRDYLANAEKINECLERARYALDGDEDSNGALSLAGVIAESTQDASKSYDVISPIADKAREILYLLEELDSDLRDVDGGDYSSGELDMTESRIDVIERMIKKYAQDEKSVLEYLQKAENELDLLENADTRYKEACEECERLKETAYSQAEKLSEIRKKAVKIFAGKVREELTYLDMPNVRLAVAFRKTELTVNGFDAVEFLLSANLGEEPKPISKIASGGELSRIMLAIKNVLAEKDEIDTLVFDEVDAGISGRAAHKVGCKLRSAGETHQIICVTHLAQIAALAHEQMLIEKQTQSDKTFTTVRQLDRDGRINEIARIIGGDTITETTLKSAAEMLKAD